MYLSSIDRPSNESPDPADPAGRRKLAVVGSNVFVLGAVSLITDVSSEMVTAILPVYLVFGLSLTPLSYGVIDGIYTGPLRCCGWSAGTSPTESAVARR